MPLEGTELGQRLAEALAADDSAQLKGVVDDVVTHISKGELDGTQIEDVVKSLQDDRRFSEVVTVADSAISEDLASPRVRRRYAQALIEQGAFHAAAAELAALLETPELGAERSEALGLKGRVLKQRHIRSGSDQLLREAIDAYARAFELETDIGWHGSNLLALLDRAARRDVEVPAGVPAKRDVMAAVLKAVTSEPEGVRKVWDVASHAEAMLSDGKEKEAIEIAGKLAGSKLATPFQLSSFRRQLIEVWERDPTSSIVMVLDDQTLQLGAGSHVELPDSSVQLEKILGTALPVGWKTYEQGLKAAKSVAKITDKVGEGWGTGFLLRGDQLHGSLGDQPVIVTNAHVINEDLSIGAIHPDDAEAHFELLGEESGTDVKVSGLSQIWSSPPTACDITVLGFDGELPVISDPLGTTMNMPPASDDAYVYIIGHPGGYGLKFSIRGNDLTAYDSEQWKVHYQAPTEPGHSGSPVFNKAWQVMALHHAGSLKMRRLDDQSVTYKANEGITIPAIKERFEAEYSPG